MGNLPERGVQNSPAPRPNLFQAAKRYHTAVHAAKKDPAAEQELRESCAALCDALSACPILTQAHIPGLLTAPWPDHKAILLSPDAKRHRALELPDKDALFSPLPDLEGVKLAANVPSGSRLLVPLYTDVRFINTALVIRANTVMLSFRELAPWLRECDGVVFNPGPRSVLLSKPELQALLDTCEQQLPALAAPSPKPSGTSKPSHSRALLWNDLTQLHSVYWIYSKGLNWYFPYIDNDEAVHLFLNSDPAAVQPFLDQNPDLDKFESSFSFFRDRLDLWARRFQLADICLHIGAEEAHVSPHQFTGSHASAAPCAGAHRARLILRYLQARHADPSSPQARRLWGEVGQALLAEPLAVAVSYEDGSENPEEDTALLLSPQARRWLEEHPQAVFCGSEAYTPRPLPDTGPEIRTKGSVPILFPDLNALQQFFGEKTRPALYTFRELAELAHPTKGLILNLITTSVRLSGEEIRRILGVIPEEDAAPALPASAAPQPYTFEPGDTLYVIRDSAIGGHYPFLDANSSAAVFTNPEDAAIYADLGGGFDLPMSVQAVSGPEFLSYAALWHRQIALERFLFYRTLGQPEPLAFHDLPFPEGRREEDIRHYGSSGVFHLALRFLQMARAGTQDSDVHLNAQMFRMLLFGELSGCAVVIPLRRDGEEENAPGEGENAPGEDGVLYMLPADPGRLEDSALHPALFGGEGLTSAPAGAEIRLRPAPDHPTMGAVFTDIPALREVFGENVPMALCSFADAIALSREYDGVILNPGTLDLSLDHNALAMIRSRSASG